MFQAKTVYIEMIITVAYVVVVSDSCKGFFFFASLRSVFRQLSPHHVCREFLWVATVLFVGDVMIGACAHAVGNTITYGALLTICESASW
jgi:hypothetical protein